ncbi:hypothetical protein [Longimicrobium sp.]|uniref:hypothetical protein n=1 Tax=Longimicrobium sp. TaxID=2029185 RepID=UPI002E35C178|nr:hypothetical protein [Longimicrobium sp.]HEX6039314.1 hypothetical protein [Longimicrobium sp.]
MQQAKDRWAYWLGVNWTSLTSGAKIFAPGSLAPPQEVGFMALPFAHPVGQVKDWGMSLADGSRIHVHEFANGTRVVHRDQHDPAAGVGPALAHLMHETPYGKLALGIGAFFFIAKAVGE